VQTQTIFLDIGMDAPVTASIVFSVVFFILADVGKNEMYVNKNQEAKLRDSRTEFLKRPTRF